MAAGTSAMTMGCSHAGSGFSRLSSATTPLRTAMTRDTTKVALVAAFTFASTGALAMGVTPFFGSDVGDVELGPGGGAGDAVCGAAGVAEVALPCGVGEFIAGAPHVRVGGRLVVVAALGDEPLVHRRDDRRLAAGREEPGAGERLVDRARGGLRGDAEDRLGPGDDGCPLCLDGVAGAAGVAAPGGAAHAVPAPPAPVRVVGGLQRYGVLGVQPRQQVRRVLQLRSGELVARVALVLDGDPVRVAVGLGPGTVFGVDELAQAAGLRVEEV